MELMFEIRILLFAICCLSGCMAVMGLTVTSEFPDSPLNVTWTHSVTSNRTNQEYLVWINNVVSKRCILWLTVRCVDCGNMTQENITRDCTYRDRDSTFNYSQNSISIIIRNMSIVYPFKEYEVFVYYSYSNSNNSVIIKTGQYISNNVSINAWSSQFPNRSISVNWTTPTTTSGVLVNYAIIVQRIDRNITQCTLWWFVNCSDCGNNTAGNIGYDNVTDSCERIENGASFQKLDLTVTTSTLDPRITAYTDYIVTIIPINGYGWGVKTIISLKTGEYKSGPVSNVTVNSNFPKNNLIIDWLVPKDTRGQIINYYIFVYDNGSNNCRLFVKISCSKCNMNMLAAQESRNITCANSTTTDSFETDNVTISTKVTHPAIQPNMTYTLAVVPINGYGWGEETRISVATKPYKPLNVTSFESIVNGTLFYLSWSPPADGIYNYTYTLQVNQSSNIINFPLLFSKNYTYNGIYLCQSVDFCIWTETPYGTGEQSCIKNHTGITTAAVVNLTLVAINRTITANWVLSEASQCDVKFTVYWNESSYNTTNLTYIISDLAYYSIYNVTVTPTSTLAGYPDSLIGISKSKMVTTPVGIPGSVHNFTCTKEYFNAFYCVWLKPSEINGPSVSYDIECKNDTIVPRNITKDLCAYFSTNVYPGINYTCTIKANNTAGFGQESITSILILASKTPDVKDETKIAITMEANNEGSTISSIPIILPYSHFTERYGRIMNFTLVVVVSKLVNMMSSPGKTYAECSKGLSCPYEIRLKKSTRKMRIRSAVDEQSWNNEGYVIGRDDNCKSAEAYDCNGPLNSNTEYQIAFRVYTTAGFGTYGFIKMSTKYDSFAVAVTVPIVVVLLLAMCITMAIVMYRRRHQQPSSSKVTTRPTDESKFLSFRASVRAFGDYYRYLRKDSWILASQQFTEILSKLKEEETMNKLIFHTGDEKKNRYRNIKPYVHNMVTLKGADSYINASRICMSHCSVDIGSHCYCTNCYIATQGPIGPASEKLTPTIGDFWRMAIQNKVRIIVNLTKCVEAYSEKCAQYWPGSVDKEETHVSGGHIVTVRLLSNETNKVFDEREFLVSMDDEQVKIVQLHFMAWPDHGCPNVHDFLTLYNRFTDLRNESDQVVVHCSAGVGRTGSFILIDIELRKVLSNSDNVEIYDTLLKLRHCRCLMVQTEKQYLFVHTIIYEYLKQNGILLRDGNKPNGNRTESTYSYLNPAYD